MYRQAYCYVAAALVSLAPAGGEGGVGNTSGLTVDCIKVYSVPSSLGPILEGGLMPS